MSHPQHWSSDSVEAVDLLVEACSKATQPKPPVLPHLIGRQLTPYFGTCEPAQGPSGKTNKQRKAAASKAAPKTSSTAAAEDELQPQHVRPKSTAHTRSGSPPDAAARSTLTRTPVVALPGGAYSCPGMFTSPKPDALPTPSSSLLMRACHQAAAQQRTAVVA